MKNKKLYISDDVLCTDYKSIIKHFDDENVHVLNYSESYNFYLNPEEGKVYVNKDPRIKNFMGMFKPGSTKKDYSNYIEVKFDTRTELYTAYSYVMNVLVQEVQYDEDDVIVEFINHSFPKKPKEKALTVTVQHYDSTVIIDKVVPSHKTNEFYRTVIEFNEGTVTHMTRKNDKNDWYAIHSCTYELFDAVKMHKKIPMFNMKKFEEGQLVL